MSAALGMLIRLQAEPAEAAKAVARAERKRRIEQRERDSAELDALIAKVAEERRKAAPVPTRELAARAHERFLKHAEVTQ